MDLLVTAIFSADTAELSLNFIKGTVSHPAWEGFAPKIRLAEAQQTEQSTNRVHLR